MATKTKKVIPWTEEEDQILIESVGKNPLNLRMCFVTTSTLIRRSPSACSGRWYGTLAKSQRKEHTAVVTMGRSVAVRNRKRYKEGMETIPLSGSIFYRVVDMLYSLIDRHE